MEAVIDAIQRQCECSREAAAYAAGILVANLASVIDNMNKRLDVSPTLIRGWVAKYQQEEEQRASDSESYNPHWPFK